MKSTGKLIVVSILFFYANCTDNVAGNSSETNNGVIIIASNNTIEGNGSNVSKVYIFSTDYNPISQSKGKCDSILADSNGTFSFQVRSWRYNVLCLGIDGRQSFTEVSVSGDNQKDTIYEILQCPGNFGGKSRIYASTQTAHNFLFIPGSPYKSEIDEAGNFMLSNVAPGQYPLKLFSDSLQIPATIESEAIKLITVKSDTTIHVQL